MTRNTPPKPDSEALDTDTIAALATASGFAGIGVVRVSGPRASEIGRAIAGRRLPPRRAIYASFFAADGEAVDAGIVLSFPGPNSFTGEDVLELQGHGGPVVMQLVLDAVLSRGARMARAGEFTERAFLNGKLDLAQAEAVADLIASASGAAARGALRSLQGAFSQAVEAIDSAVLELRVFVEAAMDFPDEGADFLSEGRVDQRLLAIREAFHNLLRETREGVLLRDGIAIALVGAPNVGKSSLLNRLAGQERAIVTDIPGTTRDLIHADLILGGLPVQIVDTAGLRETADPVEFEGVRRAREQAASADLVLLLEEDVAISSETTGSPSAGRQGPLALELLAAGLDPSRLILLRNKADLTGASPGVQRESPGAGITVTLSALTGAGIDDLVEVVKQTAGYTGGGATFTARTRHVEALREGLSALERAGQLIESGSPVELAAEELRMVHLALGSIVGHVSADELLGEIFSSFCIGK